RFLKVTGGAVAGSSLLTMLDARQAPAQLRGTTLRILTWSHFIPAYDVWFDKFSAEWGEKNGVKVRVDHIPHLEIPARMAAECAANGLKPPDTWELARVAARTLKPKGSPTGMAFSHCNDANLNWRSLMFSFGATETDASGDHPTIDSKEMREALRFAKALFDE